MSPRSNWIVVERRSALTGTSVRWGLILEKWAWNGIALSRAKAHVARDAAQEMEMAQNMPMPKTGDVGVRFEGGF